MGRVAEAVHVADLGNEHRRQHWPDTGYLLDRLIAAMGRRAAWRSSRRTRFVAIKDVDEFQQRADPLGVGTQRHLGQPLATSHSEQIRTAINTPAFASTAWICALSPDRIATSLAR